MDPAVKIIRTHVLKISQAEMAAIVGASQSTVSRWEAGEMNPDIAHMAAIRREASKRKIKWRDEWFFNPAPVSEKAA